MTPAQAAATRLAARLPARTHKIMDEQPKIGGTEPTPVIIAGCRYPSIRQAAKASGVSIGAVVKWLARGKATRA